MEAVARVTSVAGGRAWLACETNAACEACGSGRGCAIRLLAGSREALLDVPDRADDRRALQPGDSVVVRVPEGEILRAAMLAYLPPLAGLLAGAALPRALMVPPAEVVTVAAALVGAAGGWWLGRHWTRTRPPQFSVRLAPRTPAGD
jgi:sigma-E factor negative regulatory protein RseC